MVSRHPDIGAIVLECTNMPPYAFALREALGLPVYDIYSLITWLHAGLRPREFGARRPRDLLGGLTSLDPAARRIATPDHTATVGQSEIMWCPKRTAGRTAHRARPSP